MSIAALKQRNVTVAGRRTTLRLEPSMWDALEEIAKRESSDLDTLCTLVNQRLGVQRARRPPGDRGSLTLASAVRVFIAAYFRGAATEDGHRALGHGGNPFAGTPFAQLA